jgi:hypothetical protein
MTTDPESWVMDRFDRVEALKEERDRVRAGMTGRSGDDPERKELAKRLYAIYQELADLMGQGG